MKKIIFVTAFLALIAVQAKAQPTLSYNYAQASYEHIFFDDSSIDDGNGLQLLGSYSPIEHLFFELGYEYLNTKVASSDVDAHQLRYGFGAYYPITDLVDIEGRFGGLHQQAEVEGGSDAHDNEWYAGAGIRALFCDVEANASAAYVQDDQWYYSIGTVVPVADPVAFTGEVNINEDSDVGLMAGLRLIW